LTTDYFVSQSWNKFANHCFNILANIVLSTTERKDNAVIVEHNISTSKTLKHRRRGEIN